MEKDLRYVGATEIDSVDSSPKAPSEIRDMFIVMAPSDVERNVSVSSGLAEYKEPS